MKFYMSVRVCDVTFVKRLNFDTNVRSLVLLGLFPVTVTLAILGLFCSGQNLKKIVTISNLDLAISI